MVIQLSLSIAVNIFLIRVKHTIGLNMKTSFYASRSFVINTVLPVESQSVVSFISLWKCFIQYPCSPSCLGAFQFFTICSFFLNLSVVIEMFSCFFASLGCSLVGPISHSRISHTPGCQVVGHYFYSPFQSLKLLCLLCVKDSILNILLCSCLIPCSFSRCCYCPLFQLLHHYFQSFIFHLISFFQLFLYCVLIKLFSFFP